MKSAYSSGKPSFGVGAGNVQVILDRNIDLEAAAEKVIPDVLLIMVLSVPENNFSLIR